MGSIKSTSKSISLSLCHKSETIRYYDEHAEDFVAGTENADMRECRERFLRYLKPGQIILDAGCGSGRDVIAFREAGYDVEAFDASAEIW